MSPLPAFISFAVGSGFYHATKFMLGFNPTVGDFITALYWVGLCLLMVSFGWVRT